jgi:4-hydroxy 2-oxovalerate aldolase
MNNYPNITLCDVSLRDGSHAIKHQLNEEAIKKYAQFAESANIPILEVGHGNGLGASSLLIGESLLTDQQMLHTAAMVLSKTKLGVHIIPGFATIEKDIIPAIDSGVSVFRIASHCTEASVTKAHIEFLAAKNQIVFGVLMMTALTDAKTLTQEALKMQDYGANAIIIMDSTGSYLPKQVKERIESLVNALDIEVGFHAHNNLGLAVANSLTAAESGATIIDTCIRGFGAGAGNAPLELVLPVLKASGFNSNIDFDKVLVEADKVMDYLITKLPRPAPINVLTGLHQLFSGFSKPILSIAEQYGLSYVELIKAIGNRKLVAGQEDLIVEVAQKLSKSKMITG